MWEGEACRGFGRTVPSIYMCSSTLIYFTIYRINTYSTSTNLHDAVGSSATDSMSMSLDGQRTAGHPVFPLKRRQQTAARGGVYDGLRLVWADIDTDIREDRNIRHQFIA